MVKKTVGYVQLEWTCPACGSKNPGLKKSCTGCGAAQPEHVEFDQAAQEELIQDKAVIAQAQSGPDVHCAYCGTRNPAGAESCRKCGGDLTQAAAREKGQVMGAHRKEPAKPVTCLKCGSPNEATALRCSSCGSSLATEPVAKPEAPTLAPKKGNRGLLAILGALAALACIAIIVVMVLAGRTEATSGTVQRVEWNRTIVIEALRPVTHETWQDEIPADGRQGECTEKLHRTQAEPAPNAREVCGTPYTVDTGTGVGEVVQDCEYQVYAEWCAYTVDEWQAINEVTETGADLRPLWPGFTLAGDEREGERREQYMVTFSGKDGVHNYHPTTETEFLKFETGSEWTLEVNTFNQVRSVAPAN